MVETAGYCCPDDRLSAIAKLCVPNGGEAKGARSVVVLKFRTTITENEVEQVFINTYWSIVVCTVCCCKGSTYTSGTLAHIINT